MKRPIRIGVICMTANSDKKRNIDEAVTLVTEAANAGAAWVQLPEMFAFHGPYDQIFDMAETDEGPTIKMLAQLAADLKITLFAGSMGERPGPETPDSERTSPAGHRKVFNTSRIFSTNGRQIAKYRKIHLFNLAAEGDRPAYRESDGFIAGRDFVTIEVDGYRIGLSICYDLRFSGHYNSLTKEAPVDVITAPSAFTKGTGQAHWELLLRTRAVEYQAFVYASNQVGIHSPGKESWGHSMVVDPWGDILADTGALRGFAIAEIDPVRLSQVRAKLPALANRRPDIYQGW